MDLTQMKFGAKLTPRNKKDFVVASIMPVKTSSEFPDSFIVPNLPPLGRQLIYDMCMAFAFTYQRRIVESEQRGYDIPFSEACAYANRVTGDYEGEGMAAITPLRHGMNRGICRKPIFPQLGTYPELKRYFDEHFAELMADAKNYKHTAYARAYSDNEVKSALINPRSRAVIAVIPIYKSFEQITKENPVAPVPKEGEKLLGYHAVDIVGWHPWAPFGGEEVKKVTNWWDEDENTPWGDNGFFYVTKDFPLLELWVVTDTIIPGYIPKIRIEEKLIIENRTNYVLSPRGITVHSTANLGATADDHFLYFYDRYRAASAHYFVDWTKMLRTVPENEVALHAGRTANLQFLSVEMCEPTGNDPIKFAKVWKNTVELVADACVRHGWEPAEEVRPGLKAVHNHAQISALYKETDHTDPLPYFSRYGKTWEHFIADVTKEYNQLKGIENQEVDEMLEVAILANDFDEMAILKRALPSFGLPAVFFRDEVNKGKYNAEVKTKVKKLFVVGGGSIGHPNEVMISGKDLFETAYKLGQYLENV